MFKIWGAKNRRTNLHKHPGPPFQIRGGPGSFSNAWIFISRQMMENLLPFTFNLENYKRQFWPYLQTAKNRTFAPKQAQLASPVLFWEPKLNKKWRFKNLYICKSVTPQEPDQITDPQNQANNEVTWSIQRNFCH